MTDLEIDRELRAKWACKQPRAARKVKLRMRFKHKLAQEIQRTEEKLTLLREIQAEG